MSTIMRWCRCYIIDIAIKYIYAYALYRRLEKQKPAITVKRSFHSDRHQSKSIDRGHFFRCYVLSIYSLITTRLVLSSSRRSPPCRRQTRCHRHSTSLSSLHWLPSKCLCLSLVISLQANKTFSTCQSKHTEIYFNFMRCLRRIPSPRWHYTVFTRWDIRFGRIFFACERYIGPSYTFSCQLLAILACYK